MLNQSSVRQYFQEIDFANNSIQKLRDYAVADKKIIHKGKHAEVMMAEFHMQKLMKVIE